MAYNNYGQMYNPYSGYPVNPQNISYAYNTPTQQTQTPGMIWVDGEVGAKAYQMPQGHPAGRAAAAERIFAGREPSKRGRRIELCN